MFGNGKGGDSVVKVFEIDKGEEEGKRRRRQSWNRLGEMDQECGNLSWMGSGWETQRPQVVMAGQDRAKLEKTRGMLGAG